MVRRLARRIADVQYIRLYQGSAGSAVPVRHRLVVLLRAVVPSVLELDAGILPERHEVSQEKPVRRLNVVLFVRGLLRVARSHGMPDKRQRHVPPAPVIAAAVPLFGTGAVALGREAVVEEEARVPLERRQVRAM